MRRLLAHTLRQLADKLEPHETVSFATWYANAYSTNSNATATFTHHRPRPR